MNVVETSADRTAGESRAPGSEPDDDEQPPAASPVHTRIAPAVAIGVPTLVLAVHASFYGPWIEDDAGITFAYARSLATGAGPVLQPGADAVEGFSNPTWLAILVLGRWLGLFDHGAWFDIPDLVLFPKLVALACAATMFGVLLGLARTVSRHPVAVTVAAGTVTALVPSFVIWTMSGLENALYALLVVALAVTLARAAAQDRLLEPPTAITVGLLAGLAALTRPDGLVYLAAYPLAALLVVHRERLRSTARSAAVATVAGGAPVAVYLVWRLATFGDWLPNTARAKRQQLPTPADLGRPAVLVEYVGWLAVLLGAVVVALALARRSRTRTVVAATLVPVALALAAFVVLPTDWMEQYRFATPLWPLGAMVITFAVADVWPRWGVRTRSAAGVAAALAVLLTTSLWLDAAASFRRDPTAPLCFVAVSVGQRVNEYADILRVPAGGTLLAVDGGGTALTSRLRFVDLSGLTDVRFAELWQQKDSVGARDYVFDAVRPTFFKIDSGWAGAANAGLLRDPRLDRDYVVLISPRPGSGTWVRRDVVPSPQRLVAARRHAAVAFNEIDAPYLRGDRTAWHCGPSLRPPTNS